MLDSSADVVVSKLDDRWYVVMYRDIYYLANFEILGRYTETTEETLRERGGSLLQVSS